MTWTIEKMKSEAEKYFRRSDFQKNSWLAYQAARRWGVLDDVCAHMRPVSDWTDRNIQIEANRFITRGEFSLKSPSAYKSACNTGKLDFFCKHMKDVHTRWNTELLTKRAQKYESRADFFYNDNNAYAAARHRNILDQICGHMELRKTCDDDVVYIWYATEFCAYKIGVTSARLGDIRIKSVAKSAGVTPKVIIAIGVVGSATKIEQQILSFGTPADVGSFDGSTEFRHLSNSEIIKSKEIIIAHSKNTQTSQEAA